MHQESTIPPALQAVVDWVEVVHGEWSYDDKANYVNFSFRYGGFEYNATAIEDDGESLTVCLAYMIPSSIDELVLRRRISDVDITRKFGALIFNHELSILTWRDTICRDTDRDFDAEDVEDVLSYGVATFNILRVEVVGLFGENPEVVQLEQVAVSGHA